MQRIAEMNNRNDTVMGMMGSNGMDNSGMVGGPLLDEMMQQNEKDMQRRRSFHTSQSYGSNRSIQSDDPRRASMMEFGPGNQSDLEGFQFDPNTLPSNTGMQRPGNIAHRRLNSQRLRRQMSNDSLNLNTEYSSMPSYNSMSASSPYGQSIASADPMSGFDMSQDFMTNNMLMSMDFGTPNTFDGNTNGNITPRDPFMQNTYSSPMGNNQVQQNMATPLSTRTHDPGGGGASMDTGGQSMMDKAQGMQPSDPMVNMQTQQQTTIPMPNPNPGLPMGQSNAMVVPNAHGLPTYNPAGKLQPTANLDVSTDATGTPFQGKNNASQQVVPQYRNAYSSTGFDMLGVLMRVATRDKPQINIGAVDLSCAFVVCDVTQHDLPIVYCSDIFERLTAYTRHEILGRNCRFLQAPDGKIQAGVKRKYVDDQSVLRIKNMISQRQETQISLINYRKGGQPFMNLLTMIPIPWDTDEIRYYVGFQVDLVEQPTSITNKNPGMWIPDAPLIGINSNYSHYIRWLIHDQLPAGITTKIRCSGEPE